MAVGKLNIPSINSQFLDPAGGLSQAWYNYLLTTSPFQPGHTAQVQDLGAVSPFVFAADQGGALVVQNAGGTFTVEISRDNGITFYQIATGETIVPLRRLDQVQVTWVTPPPDVIWLPDT